MLQKQENIPASTKPVKREKRCSPDLVGIVNFFCQKMVQLEHGLELDKDRFIDLGVKIRLSDFLNWCIVDLQCYISFRCTTVIWFFLIWNYTSFGYIPCGVHKHPCKFFILYLVIFNLLILFTYSGPFLVLSPLVTTSLLSVPVTLFLVLLYFVCLLYLVLY